MKASAAPRPCSSITTGSIGSKIKVARIFNTYGPRMHPNDGRVVSNFIVQALRGEDITLYGDGSQTRAFCYVDDLVEGLIRLMATADPVHGPDQYRQPARNPGARTGGTGHPHDRIGIAHRHHPLPQDDPMQRCPDITLARSTLGWEPKTALEEGLTRTIAYFSRMLAG